MITEPRPSLRYWVIARQRKETFATFREALLSLEVKGTLIDALCDEMHRQGTDEFFLPLSRSKRDDPLVAQIGIDDAGRWQVWQANLALVSTNREELRQTLAMLRHDELSRQTTRNRGRDPDDRQVICEYVPPGAGARRGSLR